MFLQFEYGQELRFIPDGNAMELYVITTRYGVFSVMLSEKNGC